MKINTNFRNVDSKYLYTLRTPGTLFIYVFMYLFISSFCIIILSCLFIFIINVANADGGIIFTPTSTPPCASGTNLSPYCISVTGDVEAVSGSTFILQSEGTNDNDFSGRFKNIYLGARVSIIITPYY